MWGALQDAAGFITLVLDKSDESHRKCPRCRGSGLLENSFARLEKKAQSNQPCWFCEGVGVLPIAGLDGFVLARTTPCLKSLSKHNQSRVDVLQLNHHGHGGKTFKFTNAKLGVNLMDLSFDYNTSPWINSISLGCQQDALEMSMVKGSTFQPPVSEANLQPLSRFSLKKPCLRLEFFQRIWNASSILSIISNSQGKATLSSAPSLTSSPQSRVGLVPVNQKASYIPPLRKLRGGFAMQHASYREKTAYHNVLTTDNLQLDSELSGLFDAKLQTQTPNMHSMKRRRLHPKGRNHIRDKAVKEAQERAQGLVRNLKHKAEPDLTNSHAHSECTETTAKSLQGSGAHGQHFLASDMTHRVAWLTAVAVVSRQVLLSQFKTDS